jgi:phosphoglycolate phosphatase
VSLQLIVFDLDGTLVDSLRDIADAANALIVSCGAAPIPQDEIGAMVGDGAAQLIARAFKASGIERPPDALERYLACYDAVLLKHTRPEGIPRCSRCSADARARGPHQQADRLDPAHSDGLDLARHFPRTPCSAATGRCREPDPAALLRLAARAHATPASRSWSAIPSSTGRRRAPPGRACVSRDTGSVSAPCRFTNWHRRTM